MLQNAYELPLKEPLDPLDEVDLKSVVAIVMDTGGNEFDAAAAFMTLRIKSALEAELRTGMRVGSVETPAQLVRGLAPTRGSMKFYRGHVEQLNEITRLRKRLGLS